MAEDIGIAGKVLDALVGAGLVTAEQLANATEASENEGVPIGSLLIERGLVSSEDLRSILEEELGIPTVDLDNYAPEPEALVMFPAVVARERRMLPLFDIEGILTVALGEPADVLVLEEVSEQIGIELEPVLTDATALLGTIVQCYGEQEPAGEAPAAEAEPAAPEATAAEAPAQEVTEEIVVETPVEEGLSAEELTPEEAVAEALAAEAEVEESLVVPEAPPSEVEEAAEGAVPQETLEEMAEAEEPGGRKRIDLDVLAVADTGKVAVLVSEILEDATRAGASRIQVLPYKHDFFLVYRVKGVLEKIAAAPLSMQGALVDGFKSLARLSSVPPTLPALGRVRARYAEKDLTLTVSAVPTVAGQRLVISLATVGSRPRELPELGMTEAETKALHAMVERGRGMLLVCGPVAGGRSATYYALLAHAAEAGKTVYSLERTVEYEIPAVAQVMVNPGSPVRPTAYIAAGLGQDTDVVAMDSIQSVEDVHLAVEAAGRGKLVIATFAAGDIASGVRRMLDLGVEPHSLAAALTVAVGQRLVRTNCPNCVEELKSPLNKVIPGAAADMVSKSGSGCPNCRKTGYAGVTGIFEVLPFTEAIRAVVARSATGKEIEEAALAAGLRPLVRSGLAKIEAGEVSVEEIDRVLRLSG